MIEGNLKTHFYNLSSGPEYSMAEYHRVYSYLFVAFDQFWISENPKDIMQFRFIKEKFVARVISHLSGMESSLVNWSCPMIETL